MKLHVAINLFNGEELLEANLRNLREQVDFVTVVWQAVSYAGHLACPELAPLLERLHEERLIDYLIFFEPNFSVRGEVNETKKRNLGLQWARQIGASHHLDCDVDEFYFPDQFAEAKRRIEEEGYDTTVCRIYEYHKAPIYRCRQSRPDLYAPFIHQVRAQSRYQIEYPFYPVRIDPTRRISPFEQFMCFDEGIITMEHFSLVRKDLYRCKVRDALNRRPNIGWRLDAVWNFVPQRYDVVDDVFGLGDWQA